MRGKPTIHSPFPFAIRITPAGAGKTAANVEYVGNVWDHPRRCGENFLYADTDSLHLGSPPQVRGKRESVIPLIFALGITPAGAGKTLRFYHISMGILGSPPQVRGKQIRHSYLRLQERITPAGAGKTCYARCCTDFAWDHPRRCGENILNRILFGSTAGSPPQVRGKHAVCKALAQIERITPAGAGKTRKDENDLFCKWDHPRRCGENLTNSDLQPNMLGSPPQVRGKLLNFGMRSAPCRITPAGAGKTLKRSFRNQPFCSRAVQISFNFSNSLNVSLQSGSAR